MPSSARAQFWRERDRSNLVLEEQWRRSHIDGHSKCRRVSKERAEAIRTDAKINGYYVQVVGGVIIDNSGRCKSPTCMMGDPWGCSMGIARQYARRTAFVLERWLASGFEAVVCAVDAIGMPGEPFTDVQSRAATSFTTMVRGKGWATDKSRYGIGGYVWSLSAFTRGDRWVVRRYILLGIDSKHEARDKDWSSGMLGRLVAKLETDDAEPSFQVHDWKYISKRDASDVASFMCGAVSRRDRINHRVREDYMLSFPRGDDAEEAYADAVDGEWFVAYAKAMSGKPTWSISSAPSSDHQDWLAAVRDHRYALITPEWQPPVPEINLKGPGTPSAWGGRRLPPAKV